MSSPGQPASSPMIGRHVGAYEVLSHLGRGAMSEVYLAHHPKSGRQVALKVIDPALCADPNLIRLYEHEVWAVNHLGHPAIVEVLDFGRLDDGRAYLVTALLRGTSLAGYLTEHGRVATETARDLLVPVMNALGAIHGAGIVHKDVKPSNIFLAQGPDGAVATKLLDSGLAHLKPLAAVPGAGRPVASLPLYSAPEQVSGNLQNVGPWSDVYAVGAVLYHLLAGKPPYPGDWPEVIASQHLNSPPPSLQLARPDIHPAMDSLIHRAMAKAPRERLQSMPTFVEQLRDAAAMRAPTLRGMTSDPHEQERLQAEIRARVVAAQAAQGAPAAQAAPPGAPPYDQTPPPTVRLDASHLAGLPLQTGPTPAVPAAVPAPAPMPAPAPAPARYHAPPPARSRKTIWLVITAVAFVLAVAGTAGLVIALQDDKSDQKASETSEDSDKVVYYKKRKIIEPPRPMPTPPPVPPRPIPTIPRYVGLADDSYKVDITGRPWRGARHAKVTIALFADFQCPWSRRTSRQLKQLVDALPRDVKVVWLDFPLSYHRQAVPAAQAGIAVFKDKGSDAFWKFHDKVFDNTFSITTDNLIKWAEKAGASGTDVRSALTLNTHKKTVDDRVDQARQIGVIVTPTLFFNGKRYSGLRLLSSLKRAAESEIAAADKVIGKGGVTLETYYDHVQKTAKTSRPGSLYKKRGLGGLGHRSHGKTLDPEAIYKVPVTEDQPQQGPKSALVTIVAFSDFECPFSRRASCVLRVLLKRYPQDLRLVWRNNPLAFHQRARPAAEAAMTAFVLGGNRAFWKLHERLFQTQDCLPDGTLRYSYSSWKEGLKEQAIWRAASLSGLRLSRFQRALRRRTCKDRVDRDQQLANSLGARSTPNFFVNGKLVRGAKRLPEFEALVRRESLAARRLMLTRHVSRSRLYDAIIAAGATSPVYKAP